MDADCYATTMSVAKLHCLCQFPPCEEPAYSVPGVAPDADPIRACSMASQWFMFRPSEPCEQSRHDQIE